MFAWSGSEALFVVVVFCNGLIVKVLVLLVFCLSVKKVYIKRMRREQR